MIISALLNKLIGECNLVLKEEEWKDIAGYEGYYQISSYGRVRSLDRVILSKDNRIVNYKGKILNTGLTPNGYCYFITSKNDKRNKFLVHVAVAKAFVLNFYNKPQVNHINSWRADNHYKNLEWVTAKENKLHSVLNKSHAYGERNAFSKLTDKKAIEIYKLAHSNIPQKQIAKKYKISHYIVSKIKRKKLWKHIHD